MPSRGGGTWSGCGSPIPALDDALGLELARRRQRVPSTPSTARGSRGAGIPCTAAWARIRFDSSDSWAFLTAITAPTLIITGENGYRTGDHEHRRDQLQDVREVVLPDVGHMMHWFAPRAVADALHGFLSESV